MLVVVLAALFAALRGLHALVEPPDASAIFTSRVALVGVAGRYTLTDNDRRILAAHLDDAQVGAVSVRARYVGSCAAAGWTTLGAGRRAAVAGLCAPEVDGSQVGDWPARQLAARARSGDAQLGTLAASVSGCVAAVGPGAALAAAQPDGSLARYATAESFLAGGAKLSCPITLIDAGAATDEVVTRLAVRSDVTVIVTGIGPAAGSTDPGLQPIYRLGTTLPGWLTSASTRRTGLITLNDLTQSLISFGRGSAPATAAVDGADLEVEQDNLTVAAVEHRLASVAALSDAAPVGYLILGMGGAVLLGLILVAVWQRRWWLAHGVLTIGTVFTAAMMLCGSVAWPETKSPGLFVGVLGWTWALLLAAAALLIARIVGVPAAIAGAALTVAAFTLDAALGAVMQPGSLLNSRPIYGLRWYGFGNVTFAAYAAAGLVLAGYLAHRFRSHDRPRMALVAVALVGFGVVICQGWPSMGSDFGGVISLTPAVLWLLFALSGKVTWPRLLLAASGTVVAVAVISVVDWRRGPGRRSHLGNFVQRVIEGDALDIVRRKAVASLETILSPLGIGALLVGIPLWFVIFRFAIPRIGRAYSTARPVAIAALMVAILGTVLNDGGISVWVTLTAAVSLTAAWFVVASLRPPPAPVPRPRAKPGHGSSR